MAQGSYVEAATSFSVQVEGSPVFVTEGEMWEADDRVVKSREHLFREPTIRSTAALRSREQRRRGAVVETATAAPGERRTLSGPPAAAPATATTKSSGRPRAGSTTADPSEV